MGKRKTKIIATVYGDQQDKEVLETLRNLTGKTTSDLLKNLVNQKYKEMTGSK